MAKKEGFVNAYYRRIPAYYNPETHEIEGRNWFYSKLIDLNVWIDFNVIMVDYLPIYVETDETEEDDA
jgi:hypothetical protein